MKWWALPIQNFYVAKWHQFRLFSAPHITKSGKMQSPVSPAVVWWPSSCWLSPVQARLRAIYRPPGHLHISNRLKKEASIKANPLATVHTWTVSVVSQLGGDEKWTLKLHANNTHFGKSGHNPIHIVLTEIRKVSLKLIPTYYIIKVYADRKFHLIILSVPIFVWAHI